MEKDLVSGPLQDVLRRAALMKDRLLAGVRRADLSIFHEFSPPPGGGGHQFLRALWSGFEAQGFVVENNTISHSTRACLFNSLNFDFGRLRYLRRKNVRMVHRVDGPITVYRSRDDGSDRMVFSANQEFAGATVFQSNYSLNKHRELGMEFRNPVVIRNTVSSGIFNPSGRVPFSRERKTRILSASWSDNINKGSDIYKWLEEKLDWDRFEFTFAGRTPVAFSKIKMQDAMPSGGVAKLMKENDIFISASRFESCPNVILEALACGMPVIFHNSGGTPEVVGEAGLGFESREELPALIERIVSEYQDRAAKIKIPALDDVATEYLKVMGLAHA